MNPSRPNRDVEPEDPVAVQLRRLVEARVVADHDRRERHVALVAVVEERVAPGGPRAPRPPRRRSSRTRRAGSRRGRTLLAPSCPERNLQGMHFETAIGTCAVQWSDAGPDRRVAPRAPPGASGRTRRSACSSAVEGIVALFAGEPRDLTEVELDTTGIDDFRAAASTAPRARSAPARSRPTARSPARSAHPTRPGRSARRSAPTRTRSSCPATACSPPTAPCTASPAPGGIATKRRMLEIERAPGFTQAALF